MEHPYHDRIRGADLSKLAPPILSGQIQRLDGGILGDFVVAFEGQSTFHADVANGASSKIEFLPSAWPEDYEQSSLRQIGNNVNKRLQANDGDWDGLRSVTPTFVGQRAELQDFERLLDRNLFHLQNVCRNPITHLHSEEMRFPVSRVRRTAPRAVEYLAAHTEDWGWRTINSVQPTRVLALVSEELFDIYENRVAASLVHLLRNHLEKRYGELSRIEAMFDLPDSTPGKHQRNRRLANLLAEVFNNELQEHQNTVRAAKEVVERLYRQVSALLDSSLCRSMPKGRLIFNSAIRDTNIFVNDEHYRHVARLWRECLHWTIGSEQQEEDKYRTAQETCESFDSFCLLLVIRGMHQLDFLPCDDDLPQRDKPSRWEKNSASAEVTWRRDGTITIQPEYAAPVLQFIPLMASLASKQLQVEEIEDVYDRLVDSLTQRRTAESRDGSDAQGGATIILYPGEIRKGGDRAALPSHVWHGLHTLGNDLLHPVPQGFLPVSPYEIDSVERVSRALQWALLGSQIAAYPPEIAINEVQKTVQTATWIKSTPTGRRGSVTRLPAEHEKSKLENLLRAEFNRIASQGKQAAHEGQALTQFSAELERCLQRIRNLYICPICHEDNSYRVSRNGGDHFQVVCVECHSAWGIKTCGACKESYPFLSPGGKFEYTGGYGPGWVDAAFGMDILAVPCWIPGELSTYICPHCGACSNSSRACDHKCQRCNDQREL